jgi:glucuronate isomerase
MASKVHLSDDRYFGPDPRQKKIAQQLYVTVRDLPLICPHGHVDPRMFADPDYSFGSPADLLIIPDHYVFRMLYSQGVPMEALGIPRKDGGKVEKDHRKIWQTFADHFSLFRGTPTGMWLADELLSVFGVKEKLAGDSAQRIYDQIAEKLTRPEFRPRAMFERFNIEAMSTTDAATDPLRHHQAIRKSGWKGRVVPCFRPDGVVNLDAPNWRKNIQALSAVSKIEVKNFKSYIAALEDRRAFFKRLGATSTDHAVLTAYTEVLSPRSAEAIFRRALAGKATAEDATRFTGHMVTEMARMSIEDGLVMQLHVGSFRNHNPLVYERFGTDMGADIPISSEFTRNLRPLLTMYGNETRLTLVLFNLDESTYSRELAPLAGHYPALRLGPPWWFFDSVNGMERFRALVVETAGLANTVGFNDDTRAYPSIPARHDLSRRVDANWIAGLVARGMVDMDDALEMIQDTAYRLAKKAYKF